MVWSFTIRLAAASSDLAAAQAAAALVPVAVAAFFADLPCFGLVGSRCSAGCFAVA